MRKEFLKKFSDLLEVDFETLSAKSKLKSFQYWDSLALVSTIGLIDEYFKVSITGDELYKCESLQDIFFLIDKLSDKQ